MARILYQAKTGPVPTPAQAPEQVTESRWHQPLAEPTRLRALPAAVVAAGLAWCPQPVPTVTPEKFQRPLAEPVRVRPALPAGQQQAFIWTQPEDVTVSRWLLPLAEPQRSPSRLGTGAQQAAAFVKATPFEEVVSLDRWLRRLEEPVRVPPRLVAGAQPFLAFVKGDPFPETPDLPKWWRPLEEPVRQPLRLNTGAQQHSALVQAAPFAEAVSADRWAQTFLPPTLAKPRAQPDALAYAPYVASTSEVVTLDKWFFEFGQPVRQRPAVTWQQAAAFTKATPFGETIDAAKWFVPLGEPPVKSRPALLTAAQQAAWLVKATPFAESVSVDRWLLGLSEPQRQPLGLAARLQQTLALWPYPLPNPDAPAWVSVIYPDRVPGRPFPAQHQQALAFVKAAPFAESVSADRWLQAWVAPPPAARRVQPEGAWYVGLVSTAETVTADKWFASWQTPARAPQRPAGFVAGSPFADAPVAAWAQALHQPALRRVFPGGHQAAFYGPTAPPVAPRLDGWWQPFAEPVRIRSAQPRSGEAPWHVFVSQTGTAAHIAWFVALSDPTWPVWSVAWRQAVIAPVFFNAGLAAGRTGDGAITIGGGSGGLSAGRGADGLAVARGATGTATPRA